MSKQGSYSNFPRDNLVQNQVHRQPYPTRHSGPRSVPPRASQAPPMATSPGQTYAPSYPSYQPYQPQQAYPVMLQQHAPPLPANNAPMRMQSPYPFMPAYSTSYGLGPQPQPPQYYMHGQMQQPAGMRAQHIPTMSIGGSTYVQQPTPAAAAQPYWQVQNPVPAPQPKRQRNIIPILDPNTGRDVLADNGSARSDGSSLEGSGVRSQNIPVSSTDKQLGETTAPISSSLSADADEYRPVNGGMYASLENTDVYNNDVALNANAYYPSACEGYDSNRGEPPVNYTQDATFVMDDVPALPDSGLLPQNELFAPPQRDVTQPLCDTVDQPPGDTSVLALSDESVEAVCKAVADSGVNVVPVDPMNNIPVETPGKAGVEVVVDALVQPLVSVQGVALGNVHVQPQSTAFSSPDNGQGLIPVDVPPGASREGNVRTDQAGVGAASEQAALPEANQHIGGGSLVLSQKDPAGVAADTHAEEEKSARDSKACSVSSGDIAEPQVAAASDGSDRDVTALEHSTAPLIPHVSASNVVETASDSKLAEDVVSVEAVLSVKDVETLTGQPSQTSSAGTGSVGPAAPELDRAIPKSHEQPEPADGEPVTSKANKEPAGSAKDGISKTTVPSRGSATGSAAARPSKSMESVPKYSYREDQWSPLNPEGKKLYDREFLLTLQHAKQSLERPEGLPQLSDIILDKPVGIADQSRKVVGKSITGGDYDFTPGYVKAPVALRGPRGSSSKNDRDRGGGRRPPPPDVGPPRKVIEINREEVQLHRSDCAYKPLHMKSEAKLSKSEELSRSFRNILNKLTPQNFENLISSVLALPIDTTDGLRSVINLTFEKAVSEPGYSVAYANMCKSISSIKVTTEKPGEVVDFRKLLLTRCQREFEKDLSDEEDSKAKLEALQKAENDEVKKRLQEEYDMFVWKARRRSLGNIRFIGELFKQKMLTEAIMHDCIVKLLKNNEEDSLECLCGLLKTIGKDIDHEKAKPRNDQYFNQMKKITTQKKVSSRVRFKLQDIIDLRENNWVPRFADNNPKTIEQIHKEAAMEAQEKSMMISQVSGRGPGGGLSGRGSASGARDKPRDWPSHEKGQHSDDGWNTVGPTKMMQNAPKIDPSKMKLSKQNVGDDIQLGPGGGRPNAWVRGSRPTSSQEMERPTTPNRFTALADDAGSRSGRSQGRGDASKGSRGQLDRAAQRPPPSKLTARTSQEERSSVLEAVKTIAGGPTSRDSSQEPPRSTERRRDNGKSKQLSDEEIEKKASTIHEEYLHNVDVKEALQSIEELKQPDNIDVLVRCMISNVLERSQQARKHTAHLLSEAIKGGLISIESYLKGLCGVTEVADDLAVDVPLIWTYLSELIAPMLQADSLKMSSLLLICQPLVEVNRAGELLVKVLQESTRNLGAEKVTEMWASSGLQWSSFFSSTNDVRSVLVQHKLEFLLIECESNVHVPVSRKNTTDIIASSLEDILIRSSGSNEDVFTWHEKHIQDDPTKQRAFIRALVECVARKAIDQTGETCALRQDDLQKRAALLVRFIDKNSELELQALFALQSLLHRLQHPANILRSIFDWLYDEDIISEETFYHWQKVDDPSEREGKGVALESTKQFFTWLQNAESADP